MGIKDVNVYGDSQLVINQVREEFRVKKDDLTPYHKQAIRLLNKIEILKSEQVPKSANKIAHTLANLTATLALGA